MAPRNTADRRRFLKGIGAVGGAGLASGLAGCTGGGGGGSEYPSREVLSVQREAFQNIVNDEEFTDEALEAQRLVIDPGDHTVVEDVIQESDDLITSDPFRGINEGMF